MCLPYDANGCIYWKGKYHLMYIFQDPSGPTAATVGGTPSSTDLVNWTFHPAALVPAPGDPDTGIFSGNAFVNKEGKPMLCWFGIDAGVCVATAEDDDLIRWKKHPKNPIIPVPKPGEPGYGVYRVWDPYLWLEGDTYYCLLGGNDCPTARTRSTCCKSPDLVNWKPLHPFYEHPDLSLDRRLGRGLLVSRLLQARRQARADVHQPHGRRALLRRARSTNEEVLSRAARADELARRHVLCPGKPGGRQGPADLLGLGDRPALAIDAERRPARACRACRECWAR